MMTILIKIIGIIILVIIVQAEWTLPPASTPQPPHLGTDMSAMRSHEFCRGS